MWTDLDQETQTGPTDMQIEPTNCSGKLSGSVDSCSRYQKPAQRQDLTVTLESLVQSRYYPRWKKIFSKGEVVFVSEAKRNGDTIVNTTLTIGHKSEPLIWQLCGASPKIVSLAVDKNDLLTKLKERIQAHQAKDGYAEMISWLKGKGKSGDGGTSGGGSTVGVAENTLKTSARTIDLID